MFYLHLSNRTENLLTHLGEVLRAQPRRSLFEREVFLIQSQGMERMLSQRLADALECGAILSIMLPTRFLTVWPTGWGWSSTPTPMTGNP